MKGSFQMKKYRDCVADAFVFQHVLEYLDECADSATRNSTEYLNRAVADEEDEDGYSRQQAEEYRAKAAAYERLLNKLSK
jgi:hypothetical protein